MIMFIAEGSIANTISICYFAIARQAGQAGHAGQARRPGAILFRLTDF